jgi:hypothetical protein
MLESIANIIVDWAHRQYVRFGKWSLVVAAVPLLLGFAIVRGCTGARAGLNSAQQHFGMSDADWKAYSEREANAESGDPQAVRASAARAAKEKQPAAQAVRPKAAAKMPSAVAAAPAAPAAKASRPPPKLARPANFADWKKEDLRAIVAGKLATPDDRTATAAALGLLAARADRDDEDLLLEALTAPERLRPPLVPSLAGPGVGAGVAPGRQQGPMGPEELQKSAVAALRSTASESLRLRLARYLVHPDTPPSVRQSLIGCLEEARVENLAAQTVLYASEEIDAKVRGMLEQRFAAWSAQGLGRVLGLPASQSAPAAAFSPGVAAGAAAAGPARLGWASTPAQPLAPLSVAPLDPLDTLRWLWTDEFADVLDRRLSLAESLTEAPGTLALAASVPSPAARAAVYKMLDKHWCEAPGPTDSTSAWFGAVTDPGLLLVLKELPRREAASRLAEHYGSKGSKAGAGIKGGKGAKLVPNSLAAKASVTAAVAQRRKLAEQWWINGSEFLVENWCTRFHRTALAARGRSPATSTADAAPELPMPLHPHARVTAVFHGDWPGRLAEKVPAAARDPLDIYYVRIEEKNQPERILGYYRRQLQTPEQRSTQRGAWLDHLGSGSQPERKRSVDVLVTRAVPGVPALGGEDQELIIEILWIEAKDPSLHSDALAQGSPQP